MKKTILLNILILTFSFHIYSQITGIESAERLKKGEEIILNARKAIGLDKENIKTFSYKTKTMQLSKTDSGNAIPETNSETKAILPDKIQSIWSIDGSAPSKTTKIWNAEKYKSFFEMEMSGTRTVKDTTNSNSANSLNSDSLKSLEGKISKERLDFLKNAKNSKRPDPKLSFYESVWTDLFPVILTNPFEPNLEFKYVGKAEAGKRTANIVDVQSKSGKTFRLFFDTETNYLLMMTCNYKTDGGEFGGAFDGDREFKYYFSNRQPTGELSIPRTIKIESTFTPLASKETKLFYTTVEIEELSLNPKLKDDLFKID